jgi:hypothetical protein
MDKQFDELIKTHNPNLNQILVTRIKSFEAHIIKLTNINIIKSIIKNQLEQLIQSLKIDPEYNNENLTISFDNIINDIEPYLEDFVDFTYKLQDIFYKFSEDFCQKQTDLFLEINSMLNTRGNRYNELCPNIQRMKILSKYDLFLHKYLLVNLRINISKLENELV